MKSHQKMSLDWKIGVWLCAASLYLGLQSKGAAATISATYDGNDFIPCVSYIIGRTSPTSYNFSEAVEFDGPNVGSVAIKRVVLPLTNDDGLANALNFKLSIVRDELGAPGQDAIWSAFPVGVGRLTNYSFTASGTLRAGNKYWLVFESLVDDTRSFSWPLASSPLWYCRPDVPPNIGRTALTISPSGQWYVSDYIRPAYLIEGNHLPEAVVRVQLAFMSPNTGEAFVIARNNRDVLVTLDGSTSVDVDGSPLTYAWVVSTNVIGVAPVITKVLTVGTHEVLLRVSDGDDSTASSVSVHVITPGAAVRMLKTFVLSGMRDGNKQPLIVTLDKTSEAYDSGNANVATNTLRMLQNKIRAQVSRSDSQFADLIGSLIDEISGP